MNYSNPLHGLLELLVELAVFEQTQKLGSSTYNEQQSTRDIQQTNSAQHQLMTKSVELEKEQSLVAMKCLKS